LETALATAKAAIPTNTAAQLANELAFANYVVAENNFRRKGAANTVTDTNNYVAARRAWDGLTKSQMFFIRTNAQGGSVLIEDRTATNPTLSTSGADSATYAQKAVSAISNLRTDQGVDGVTGTNYPGIPNSELTEGTLAALLVGVDENLQEALNKADFDLRVYDRQFGVVVKKFRELNARIASTLSTATTAAASNATTKFTGFPAAADVSTTITFFTNFNKELNDLVFPTSVNFTFTAALGVSNSPTLSAVTANNVRDANLALSRANTSVTRHTASVAFYQPFVAPFLDAYNAALLVDGNAIALLKVEPTVRLFAAKDLLKANVKAMSDLQNEINLVNQQSGGVVATTGGFGFGSTVAELRASWAADRTARIGNRTTLAKNIEVAENNITEHGITKVKDQAMIAKLQAELAAKQTQLTVLEALLAKYQALVLAAIAG
jgi:hypothetical protein